MGKLLIILFWLLGPVVFTQAQKLPGETIENPIPPLTTVSLSKNPSGNAMYFAKPSILKNLAKIPKDLYEIGRSPFKGKNWIWLGAVTASTLAILPIDQQSIRWVRDASADINLEDDVQYNVVLKAGDTKILKLPKNINTALYQMGEGGTSILLAAGLYGYGKIFDERRAVQSAFDISEAFVAMGLTTQIFKRISGRQSPFKATADGGEWSPLPAFSSYQNNTSNFDAFPSGHLATMMATVTVLAFNYPEKKWIRPVGYSVLGLTSWAMMNTEVHWLSDYPLALAIGYLAGRISTNRHKKEKPNAKKYLF